MAKEIRDPRKSSRLFFALVAASAASGCAELTVGQNILYAPLASLDVADAALTFPANTGIKFIEKQVADGYEILTPYDPRIGLALACYALLAVDVPIRILTGHSPEMKDGETTWQHLRPWYQTIRDMNKEQPKSNPSPTEFRRAYLPRSRI